MQNKKNVMDMNNEIDYLNYYLKDLDTVNPRTIYTYGQEIKRYFKFCIDRRLKEPLCRESFICYKRSMVADGISPNTINHRTVILRSFAAYISNQNGKPSFMYGIKLERTAEGGTVEAAEYTDIKKALAAADERERLIIYLCAYCGLRSVEVARLNRCDLVQEKNGDLKIMVSGKGYNGSRSRMQPVPVKLQRFMRAAFGDALPAWQATPKCEKIPLIQSTSHNNKGGRCDVISIQRIIKNAFARVGVVCSSHQLRHAYAIKLLRSDVEIEKVRQLLGHKNVATTLHYLHEGLEDSKTKTLKNVKFDL